jgi:hypothetical protein
VSAATRATRSIENDQADNDGGEGRGEAMNKTKRVAWHKHLKKAKKRSEKARVQTTQASAQTSASRHPAPARR